MTETGETNPTRPQQLMGIAELAERLGETQRTVSQWVWRAAKGELPPFPTDTMTSTAKPDRFIFGWKPERLPEIERWRDNLPGKGWRKGKTGESRYTTYKYVKHPRSTDTGKTG
jgi:hypothetical protein